MKLAKLDKLLFFGIADQKHKLKKERGRNRNV